VRDLELTSLPFPPLRSLSLSSVFNDFGPAFNCVDATGEAVLSGMVVEIENVRASLSNRTYSLLARLTSSHFLFSTGR